MKKYSILVGIAILTVAGVILFMKKPATPEASKFFSPSEILASDILVKVTDGGFEPVNLEIKAGQRVVWVNETSDFAWPASNPHPTHTGYAGFDPEEPLAAGEAWAFVFDQPGDWGVHDHLKPGKRGMIKVSE